MRQKKDDKEEKKKIIRKKVRKGEQLFKERMQDQISKCLNQIISENKPYNLRLCTFTLHKFQDIIYILLYIYIYIYIYIYSRK